MLKIVKVTQQSQGRLVRKNIGPQLTPAGRRVGRRGTHLLGRQPLQQCNDLVLRGMLTYALQTLLQVGKGTGRPYGKRIAVTLYFSHQFGHQQGRMFCGGLYDAPPQGFQNNQGRCPSWIGRCGRGRGRGG